LVQKKKEKPWGRGWKRNTSLATSKKGACGRGGNVQVVKGLSKKLDKKGSRYAKVH